MSGPPGLQNKFEKDGSNDLFWTEIWNKKFIMWHREETVHKSLLAHQNLLPNSSSLTNSPAVVFVPLAGKSSDLAWLVRQGKDRGGLRVVAVDCVEQAVIEFFQEQKETFPSYTVTKNSETGITEYRSSDSSLIYFVCDIFSPSFLSSLDRVDFVWDRASLVAVGTDVRRKYVKLLIDALAKGTDINASASSSSSSSESSKGKTSKIILTEVLEHGRPIAPPHSITAAAFTSLYESVLTETGYGGAKSEIKLLDENVEHMFGTVKPPQQLLNITQQQTTAATSPSPSAGPPFTARIFSVQISF